MQIYRNKTFASLFKRLCKQFFVKCYGISFRNALQGFLCKIIQRLYFTMIYLKFSQMFESKAIMIHPKFLGKIFKHIKKQCHDSSQYGMGLMKVRFRNAYIPQLRRKEKEHKKTKIYKNNYLLLFGMFVKSFIPNLCFSAK